MDLQEILDELVEIKDSLVTDSGKWHSLALVELGELIGKLTVQVEAEKAFAEAEETEGAPV
jgi:acyl carrier protein